uniref:NADH dehydrogenase [ubiquinone] 1 alpha subcomplex subunit 1 n=1 Tax=Picea sitchensis TaxID=3332 RepID=A9P1A1_PICSI|nr:unknown [Picea sitchensis]
MNFIFLEAMLPLGIIAGALCVMGASQHFIHKAAYGRVFKISTHIVSLLETLQLLIRRFKIICNSGFQPKHVRSDKWDVAMDRRDRSLMEAAASMKQSMAN